MSQWYEARIDRQIREAQERGDFDDLPGTGKPVPDRGESYDEEWWIRGLARRENLALTLPVALALRREVEDLPATLARKRTEAAVREVLVDLNERIRWARRGPVEGPPVSMGDLDIEAIVEQWRARRSAS
jgi:hypothetical protein